MLLKGCQKKIICLRATDSRLFREVFFVLRHDAAPKDENDILTEAGRILDENILRRTPRARRKGYLSLLLAFLAGIAVCAAVMYAI